MYTENVSLYPIYQMNFVCGVGVSLAASNLNIFSFQKI